MAFFSDDISDNLFIPKGNLSDLTSVTTEDLSKIILRQSDYDNGREFSMDRDMLRIFAGIDGKRSLADLSLMAGLSTQLTVEVVRRLLEAGVVEIVEEFEKNSGSVFLNFLEKHLALAIGPIASLVLEDEVEAMKESWKAFPMGRAPELVNLLARQIPREEKRFAFQQVMIQFLKDTAR